MRTGRTLRAAVVAGLFSAVAVFAAAQPASASTVVSGFVECVSENPVVGVWVDAASGTDGWASTSSTGLDYYKHWQYTLTSGSSYQLHVGCGGTPAKWEYQVYCPTATGGHSFNVYDPDTGYDFCQQV